MKNIKDFINESQEPLIPDGWEYGVVHFWTNPGDITFENVVVFKAFLTKEEAMEHLQKCRMNEESRGKTIAFSGRKQIEGFYSDSYNNLGSKMTFVIVKPRKWIEDFRYIDGKGKTKKIIV